MCLPKSGVCNTTTPSNFWKVQRLSPQPNLVNLSKQQIMMNGKMKQTISYIQHKLAGQENKIENSNVHNWKMFVVFL
jgi:hypothetical protein